MKKLLAFILSLIMSLSVCFLVGCNNNGNRVLAVAIVPVQTFVKEVVKDKFEVVTAIPSGQSPETYEPKPKEITLLNKAEIYFSIGIPNESVTITPNLNVKTKQVFLHEQLISYGFKDRFFDSGARDPHVWLSVLRAIKCVEIIRDEVIKIDKENATFYTQNANEYILKLTALKTQLDNDFSNLSSDKKKVIVYHPSYGYFLDEYNLTMYALEKDGHEITPKILSEMIEFAKANNVKKVFYQAQNSGVGAEAFASEIGGKAYMLDPLSGEYINNIKKMANSFIE